MLIIDSFEEDEKGPLKDVQVVQAYLFFSKSLHRLRHALLNRGSNRCRKLANF